MELPAKIKGFSLKQGKEAGDDPVGALALEMDIRPVDAADLVRLMHPGVKVFVSVTRLQSSFAFEEPARRQPPEEAPDGDMFAGQDAANG